MTGLHIVMNDARAGLGDRKSVGLRSAAVRAVR